MKVQCLTLGLLTGLAVAGSAHADAVFEITEIYAGMTGEDGTNDWFEVTNTGDMAGDTGTLYYDDDSADPTEDANLTSFILAPGASAIFLVADDDTDFEDDTNPGADLFEQFTNIWGSVANLGLTHGGGALGQSGDTIFLYDGNTAGANQVASAMFDGSFENNGATIDFLTGPAASVVGVNGAFESAVFFNDNIGGGTNSDEITLVGSPGVVPEPGSLALLVTAGLATLRRRRA
ncbi:MAG: PEP-CTERM sorting domain-containing protein [Phycisphaerales bacterium JB063]